MEEVFGMDAMMPHTVAQPLAVETDFHIGLVLLSATALKHNPNHTPISTLMISTKFQRGSLDHASLEFFLQELVLNLDRKSCGSGDQLSCQRFIF